MCMVLIWFYRWLFWEMFISTTTTMRESTRYKRALPDFFYKVCNHGGM